MKRLGIITTFMLATAATVGGAAADDNAVLADDDFNFEHVSCNGHPNQIRIIITGVKESVGLISADLFPNKEEGFLRGSGRLSQVRFAAKSPVTKFCVDAPEAGLFAMSVYHDENANGHFDKTGLGLPAEPWGLSNNPKVLFRPPPVEKTVFDVTPDNGAQVHIKLN